jgi:hypothetical protein
MATIATVSPTELIRSTWGNSVASEFNTQCVKVNGAIGDGTSVSQWMTGSLTIHATPALKLRSGSDTPTIQFETTGGGTLATVFAMSTGLRYNVNTGSLHAFNVNAAQRMSVDNNGAAISGSLTVTGTGSFGGSTGQVKCIDTAGGNSAYVAFHGSGTVAAPGTRHGNVGFGSSTTLQLVNERAPGPVTIQAGGTGALNIQTGTSGPINLTAGSGGTIAITSAGGGHVFLDASGTGVIKLSTGGAERGRIDSNLMWGKTSPGEALAGVELFEGGTIYSTTQTNGVANMRIRHNTNADNAGYIQFVNATGGVISQIQQDFVTPFGIEITSCAVTAPSDYRLKNDLGPIVGALTRILQTQPKHLAWKDTGSQFDGFIAHELAAVVPEAVSGEKDAVYDVDEAEQMGVETGAVKAQQLDQTRLIPLLTAAVQELAARLETLEAG